MGRNARAHVAAEWVRRQINRVAAGSVYGVAVAARLLLVGVVLAAPSLLATVKSPLWNPAVRLSTAVAPGAGSSAAPWPPGGFPFALASAAPPVADGPGPLGLPAIALKAYRNAERLMATSTPGCGVSWNLLAGIGYVESKHAFGGATDSGGTTTDPIFGPRLDGSLYGNQVIVAGYDASGSPVYARAMGPMQFLPSTWKHYAADGDGNGEADPQNLYDAALAAARYLCADGTNLHDHSQLTRAVLRYNHSWRYVQHVLGWAEGYVTGVAPRNLPPIVAPRPPVVYVQPVPAEAETESSADTSRGRNPRGAGPAASQVSDGAGSSAPAQVGNGRTGTTRGSIRATGGGVSQGSSGASSGVRVGNGRTGGARGG